MPGKRRGIAAERELAQILWEKGWAVIRGPASGAGVRKRFQPDLIAVKNRVILVFEVKTAGESKPIYIEKRKVDNLKEWSRRAGGEPIIAVKILRKGWRIHRIENLTDAGASFKLENPANGEHLESFLNRKLGVTKPLDEYLQGDSTSG